MICSKCVNKIRNSKRTIDDIERIGKFKNEQDKMQELKLLWCEHENDECNICKLANRPFYEVNIDIKGKKRKDISCTEKGTLKFDMDTDDIFSFDQDTQTIPLDFNFLLPEKNRSRLICSICLDILKINSVRTKCGHYFCSNCMTKCFQVSKSNDVSCPVCYTKINYDDISGCDYYFRTHLHNCEVICSQCNCCEKYENIALHSCKHELPILSPKTPTIRDILNRNQDSPLAKKELKVVSLTKSLTHLTNRQERQGVLVCPTGGQSRHYVRVAKPRTSSEKASKSSVKKRSNDISKIRETIPGNESASLKQHEISSLTRQIQETILETAKVVKRVKVSAAHTLSLKAGVGLNYNELRRTKKLREKITREHCKGSVNM